MNNLTKNLCLEFNPYSTQQDSSQQDLNKLMAENLEFIENLTAIEIAKLWGDDLEKELDANLKDIDLRMKIINQFFPV